MGWGGYVFYGILALAMVAVFGEWLVIGAVIALGKQAFGWLQTGTWEPYTLASLFKISPDVQLTGWFVVDKAIHYVLFDTEVAVVLLLLSGAALPLKEWMDRPSPQKPAKAPKASPAPAVPQRVMPSSYNPPRTSHVPVPSRPAVAPVYLAPSPSSSMLVRFGIFLGWIFNAAALACAAPSVIIFVSRSPQPLRNDDIVMMGASLAIAGAVWLLGRGVRYVFVGPKDVSPTQDFVERFYDPNAPVRLGPYGSSEPPVTPRSSVPVSTVPPRHLTP
jgi:hypothetical protein